MLPEDLSILNNYKEESLLDKYSNETNIAPVYKSIYDEAQTPIYKQSKSVLDSVHNALSNTSELNNLNPNSYFNIKGRNLGEMGVLERMAGFVANREDLDFSSISLAETYKDKALDTKVMGGLYNFTLTDMYSSKDSWLRMQGAYTFGGMVHGKDNIESDNLFLEDSINKNNTQNRNVFEPKNNLTKFMSNGLLNKTDSLENSSIYQAEEFVIKKNEKELSMQDLIDKKLKEDSSKNDSNMPNNLFVAETISKKQYAVYSETNVYQEDFIVKKEEDKKKKLKTNINLFKHLKQNIKKTKNNYGLNIDTIKQTADANQKKFDSEKKEIKKEKLVDNHNINQLITPSNKKNIEKINLLKKEILKTDNINKNIINKPDFKLNLESNTDKKIKKLNINEDIKKEIPIIKNKDFIIKNNDIKIESSIIKKDIKKLNFKEELFIKEEKEEQNKIEIRKEKNLSFLI
jgi:hypothetical protein